MTFPARALAIAEAQPAGAPRPLAPVPAASGHWASPCEVDPFTISLEDKLALLFEAEGALRIGDERLVLRTTLAAVATTEQDAARLQRLRHFALQGDVQQAVLQGAGPVAGECNVFGH